MAYSWSSTTNSPTATASGTSVTFKGVAGSSTSNGRTFKITYAQNTNYLTVGSDSDWDYPSAYVLSGYTTSATYTFSAVTLSSGTWYYRQMYKSSTSSTIYYSTIKSITISSGHSLTIALSSGISSITGFLSTDYTTVTIKSGYPDYGSKQFTGLQYGDYFYVSGVSYDTNYSYPVTATNQAGTGYFTMINSNGSWSDHYISMPNSSRQCIIYPTYYAPTPKYTVYMYYLYGSTQIATSGSTTEESGTMFYVDSHVKSITGYTFSYSIPSSDFEIYADTEVNYYYVPYTETPIINVYSSSYNSLSINVGVSAQNYSRTVQITCAGLTQTKTISANSTVSPTATFTGLVSGSGYTVNVVVKYGTTTQGSASKVCYTNYNFTGFNFVAGNPITYLTASDWNLFRTYLSGKCSRHSVIYSPSTVSQGGTLYATDYNNVVQAFKNIGYTSIETLAPKVLSGGTVYAYPFSVFKSYLNSSDN